MPGPRARQMAQHQHLFHDIRRAHQPIDARRGQDPEDPAEELSSVPHPHGVRPDPGHHPGRVIRRENQQATVGREDGAPDSGAGLLEGRTRPVEPEVDERLVPGSREECARVERLPGGSSFRHGLRDSPGPTDAPS